MEYYEMIGQRFVQELFDKAKLIGNDKKLLKKRLHEGASVFDSFKVTGSKFDFDRKNLVNKEGTLCVQWINNGNTSTGACHLVKI